MPLTSHHLRPRRRWVWLLAGAVGLAPTLAWSQEAPVPTVVEGNAAISAEGEVLTRGPVHEAFAEQVQLNPGPGAIVPKEPPAPIDEVPPEEKPIGDNVAWIPGYWAWDEERDDFLWISGVWRVVPEGMQWIPGYWAQAEGGYQWVPGTWTSAARADVEAQYYPAPPQSLETGPSSPSPGPDQVWAPGYWNWNAGRYQWRPGYWYQARPGVMWIPPRYLWSPSGYLYAPGYWDYEFARRGLLFAPVYFPRGVYARPGFRYGPRVWINVAGFALSLFARPSYRHYYFGDYYAPSYAQVGFQPWYAYRGGYDPVYSYYRFHHRNDPHWSQQLARAYDYRRDNPNSRPPRTYQALIAQARTQNIVTNNVTNHLITNNVIMAATLNDYAKVQANVDNHLKLQKIDKVTRDRERQAAAQLHEVRQQRSKLERTAAANLKAGAKVDAGLKLALPKSPVTATVIKKPDVGVAVQPGVVQQPRVQQPRVEQPRVELPKTELPTNRLPKGETPRLERPRVETPKVNVPKVETPKVAPPKVDVPKVETPQVVPPRVERPRPEQPRVEIPKVAPPRVEVPKVAPPKVEIPKVAPPRVQPPKVAPPKVEPKPAPPRQEKPKPIPTPQPPKVEKPKPAPAPKPQPRPEAKPEKPAAKGGERQQEKGKKP